MGARQQTVAETPASRPKAETPATSDTPTAHNPITPGARPETAGDLPERVRRKDRPAGHTQVHADIPAAQYGELVAVATEHAWRLADVIRGSLAQALGNDRAMRGVARQAAESAEVWRACADVTARRHERRRVAGITGRPRTRTRPAGFRQVHADLPDRMHGLLVAECAARQLSTADVIRGALSQTLCSPPALARVESYLVERARSLFMI